MMDGVIGVDRPTDRGDDWWGRDHQSAWPRITTTFRTLTAMASRKPDKGRRKKDRLPKRLFKQRRGPTIPPGTKVVYEPAGREKMSEVLEDFIEPYRHTAETEDDFRKLLTLGVLAWNAALLPEDQRRAMIDETLGAGFSRASAPLRAEAREFVELLVRRKEEHFAANQRAIFSFELRDTGTGFHLSVASSL